MGNSVRNFDSLTYSNELRKVGVPEDQANLQAKVLFQVIEEQLLNKQDLDRVEAKLSNDIKEVKAELSSDIEKIELRLKSDIKDSELRLVFRLTAIITLVGALLKYLPAIHF